MLPSYMAMVVEAMTELDMEVAEQLIQLSGCDDEEEEGRGSENKSVHSYEAQGWQGERARSEEEVATVVSTVKRRDEGSERMRGGEEKGAAYMDGGDGRRRPRFRSLAAIYRETRRSRDWQREEERGQKRARDGEVDHKVARYVTGWKKDEGWASW